MRCIVCDTGPLLHLGEASVRHLLPAAGEVHIPKAVDLEMGVHEATWRIQRLSWLQVTALDPARERESSAWQQAGLLHSGEAQAIALARQLKADWLLTDDAAARLVGQSLGLEVHGSLGLVLWAAVKGHRTQAEADSALERLARSSLWVSSSVMRAAKAALRRIF